MIVNGKIVSSLRYAKNLVYTDVLLPNVHAVRVYDIHVAIYKINGTEYYIVLFVFCF